MRRYSEQDRERLIDEQVRSGLTKRAFSERAGIPPWTFYRWTCKPRALARRPRLAEVEVAALRMTAAVEVLLPNGARVGIRHEGQREDLVALVRGVAGCRPEVV